MKHAILRKTLATGVASALLTNPVLAQSVLEEVVVVAQKREQNLQDVPIAINAFTGRQMDALGVSESFDIAAFSPGVHISGNLAGQNNRMLACMTASPVPGRPKRIKQCRINLISMNNGQNH